MSIPRAMESLGVAAAVLNGMIIQLVAAATIEERRRVAQQVDSQINILLEELDAYRTRTVCTRQICSIAPAHAANSLGS